MASLRPSVANLLVFFLASMAGMIGGLVLYIPLASRLGRYDAPLVAWTLSLVATLFIAGGVVARWTASAGEVFVPASILAAPLVLIYFKDSTYDHPWNATFMQFLADAITTWQLWTILLFVLAAPMGGWQLSRRGKAQ